MTLVKRIAAFITREDWNPRVIRIASRVHRFLFTRLALGRFRWIGQDALILTTRGRRTGRSTSTPLFFARQGDRLYIAGSFVGSGRQPNWLLNLEAHPEVTVATSTLRGPYRARIVSESEASVLWPKLDALYPTYARYRARTRRTMRIIELSPSTGDFC